MDPSPAIEAESGFGTVYALASRTYRHFFTSYDTYNTSEKEKNQISLKITIFKARHEPDTI